MQTESMPGAAEPSEGAVAEVLLERCEIEARRVAEPPFRGHPTHEFRAIASTVSATYVAGRVRYKGPHAVDLTMPEHRNALDTLVRQLEGDGWASTGERGVADHSLRLARPADPERPIPAAPRPSLVEWYEGLTKHTKRLVDFFGGGLVLAGLVDVFLAGQPRLTAQWPSILSIAVALVWAMAAWDDFQMGTHHRIPKRVESEGSRHPIGWYRWFLMHVVKPNKEIFGWSIPGSMYLVALAYLSGVLVPVAAVGALFLLGNMFLFLNLKYVKDDFVSLGAAQVIILVTNPGGIPAILRALGVLS